MNDKTKELVAAYRDETYEPPTHVVERWHDAIDEAAAIERGRARDARGRWHPQSFLMGLGVAATLAIGIAIGYFAGNESGTAGLDYVPVALVETSGTAVPVALSRGLQTHFRDSRAQLLGLGETADRSELVLQILEQNRLFEVAADRSNAPQVARVLRAIEPILLRLATEELSEQDIIALRSQLAFEMNVMLTKLARESSDDSHTT